MQAALRMDMRAQPSGQRRQLARHEPGIEVGNGALRRRHELGGGHGAQGVGRKIAERAVVPMDVLQTAAPVVGRNHTEHRLHRLIPCPGQIGHRQVAVNQRLFEPEAQNDVGRIGHLVRIHADQSTRHPSIQPPEITRREGSRIAPEYGVQFRSEKGQERIGAAG